MLAKIGSRAVLNPKISQELTNTLQGLLAVKWVKHSH